MPIHPIKPGEKAHWKLEQTLAWIAWRGPDRTRHDWPPEIAEAYRQLMVLLESGEVKGSRRIARNGPRQPIEPLEWCDVVLSWFPVPLRIGQDEPRFYDRNTPDRDFAAATAEPWQDVLFVVADVLKAFPAPAEAEENPPRSGAPLSTIVAFCRSLKEVKKNRGEMDAALKDKFGFLPRATCDDVRRKAGFAGKKGRPPKPK